MSLFDALFILLFLTAWGLFWEKLVCFMLNIVNVFNDES